MHERKTEDTDIPLRSKPQLILIRIDKTRVPGLDSPNDLDFPYI